MARIIENAHGFPLHVTRTAEGLYTVEAVGVGLAKTGANLAEIEASVRMAMGEILAVSKRHALEAVQGAAITGQVHGENISGGSDARTIEKSIMRWARLCLIVLVIGLVVVFSVKETIVSKFASSGSASATAQGVARVAAKVAQVLQSVTPDRRNEVTANLHSIALSLQPYAAEMRPVWMACCGPQAEPYAAPETQAMPAPQGK